MACFEKSIIVGQVMALDAHGLGSATGRNNYNTYRASYRSTYGASYKVTGRDYIGPERTTGWGEIHLASFD